MRIESHQNGTDMRWFLFVAYISGVGCSRAVVDKECNTHAHTCTSKERPHSGKPAAEAEDKRRNGENWTKGKKRAAKLSQKPLRRSRSPQAELSTDLKKKKHCTRFGVSTPFEPFLWKETDDPSRHNGHKMRHDTIRCGSLPYVIAHP